MYSEKLKQLIKDKTPLKFRVKSEQQSRELQNFLFALDVDWGFGDPSVPMYTDEPFLFYNDSSLNGLTWVGASQENHFNQNKVKEFDLTNDCLVEECKWPNLKKLVDAKTPLKFRVKDAQQSRKVQAFLFYLGVRWRHTEDTCHRKNFLYMFLGCFCSSPDEYKIAGCKSDSDTCCFDNEKSTEYKEFDLENDCLVEGNLHDIVMPSITLYENPTPKGIKEMLNTSIKILKHIEGRL